MLIDRRSTSEPCPTPPSWRSSSPWSAPRRRAPRAREGSRGPGLCIKRGCSKRGRQAHCLSAPTEPS
eukprot:850167-Pyramimonas_sp.AAC.1